MPHECPETLAVYSRGGCAFTRWTKLKPIGANFFCMTEHASVCTGLQRFRNRLGFQQIPQILHQNWLSPKGASSPSHVSVPAEFAPLVQQWARVLPGWSRQLWHSADTRSLWVAHAPELLDVYDAYNFTVQRADASRLLYMHLFGGLYADLDVAPCNALQSSLTTLNFSRAAAGASLQLLLVREPKFGVTNFFLASAPGHPFWRWALSKLRSAARRFNPVVSTGPQWFNSQWNAYKSEAKQARCLDTLEQSSQTLTLDQFQNSFAAHHWSGTWHDAEAKARHDPSLFLWLGVNHSRTCPEARFGATIATSWGCRNKGSACPKRTWAEYMSECNGTINGCNPSRRRKNATTAEAEQTERLRMHWMELGGGRGAGSTRA